MQIGLSVITVIACLAGVGGAYLIYLKHKVPAETVEPELLANGWYYDKSITQFMGGPGRKGFDFVAWVVDRKVIDGAVNGLGSVVRGAGTKVRPLQSGYVRNYALGLAVGAIVIVGFFVVQVKF